MNETNLPRLDYTENHLIAYIGNKRRLLPLIAKAVDEIKNHGSRKIDEGGIFIDFFAGTGVVGRLAKTLGYQVISNDWEHYASLMNKAFLETSPEDIELFDSEGGLDAVLDHLNSLSTWNAENAYISEYYCPADDLNPDPDQERLFYTRYNGILIDNIRAEIDKMYPANKGRANQKKRNLLLALLVYEASTRSNTSGVFKAFHHGFGGRGSDALSRIMKKVELKTPVLCSSSKKAKVFRSDANRLAKKLSGMKAEIAYLDPPYNQHQYGSNYHLLNTIVRADRPEVSRGFYVNGRKTDKSAIRKDWVKTKSTYCSQAHAAAQFADLIESINAKYILVSYSTEGFIDFETMLAILAKKGRPGIVTTGYVRYRGGRQANETKNKNVEFVLIVDTQAVSRKIDIDNLRGVLTAGEAANLCEETFPVLSGITAADVIIQAGKAEAVFADEGLQLKINDRLQIDRLSLEKALAKTGEGRAAFCRKLRSIVCATNADEVAEIARALSDDSLKLDRRFLMERLVRLYSKISPEKAPEAYVQATGAVVSAASEAGLFTNWGVLSSKLVRLAARGKKSVNKRAA